MFGTKNAFKKVLHKRKSDIKNGNNKIRDEAFDINRRRLGATAGEDPGSNCANGTVLPRSRSTHSLSHEPSSSSDSSHMTEPVKYAKYSSSVGPDSSKFSVTPRKSVIAALSKAASGRRNKAKSDGAKKTSEPLSVVIPAETASSETDTFGPLPIHVPKVVYHDGLNTSSSSKKDCRRSISVSGWPSQLARTLSHFRKSRRNSVTSTTHPTISSKRLVICSQTAVLVLRLPSLCEIDLPKDILEDATVAVATTSNGAKNGLEINKIILESRDNVYTLFMKAHHCCDLIPLSVKITAVSSDLPILKAFCAYVYNGVRASPLYFSDLEGFNGMITATDFIEIMTKFYHDGPVSDVLKDLEGFTISSWLSMQKSAGHTQKPFVYVDPQDSLFKAVQVMYNNHIHRLALVDQINGNVEFIVSYKRLLKFIFIYIKDLPFPTYMCGKPKELGVGEWNNVVTVSENIKIIDLFRVFVETKKCFLPVVDANMKLVNCCSKVDVIRYNIYHHLDAPIQNALNDPARNFHGVYTCTETDCLMTVLEKMAKNDVHRLVAVDAEEKVVGLVSLSDIFRFLVLEPPQTAEPRVIDRQELTTTVTIEDSD